MEYARSAHFHALTGQISHKSLISITTVSDRCCSQRLSFCRWSTTISRFLGLALAQQMCDLASEVCSCNIPLANYNRNETRLQFIHLKKC